MALPLSSAEGVGTQSTYPPSSMISVTLPARLILGCACHPLAGDFCLMLGAVGVDRRFAALLQPRIAFIFPALTSQCLCHTVPF